MPLICPVQSVSHSSYWSADGLKITKKLIKKLTKLRIVVDPCILFIIFLVNFLIILSAATITAPEEKFPSF